MKTSKQRFSAFVRKRRDSDCWTWRGSTIKDGRGVFWLDGKMITAPRAALILNGWRIPPGMVACHHCDYPNCVNPKHLFIGTVQNNARDASAKGRLSGQEKTHCKRGHEFTADNTIRTTQGRRSCRICQRMHGTKHDHKRRKPSPARAALKGQP